MKEVDFLPEWYRNGRRRRTSYRTQYIALGGMFIVMLTWNIITSNAISKATAEISRNMPKQKDAESISSQYTLVNKKLEQLQVKANVLEKIDSKINVASVLAELSFLIDKTVALSRVELLAGKLAERKLPDTRTVVPVRAAYGSSSGRQHSFLGPVRFKVLINGIAADGSDVAQLICSLEDSPYFTQVVPSFSRSKKMRTAEGAGGEEIVVTEFEISCYLANYKDADTGS